MRKLSELDYFDLHCDTIAEAYHTGQSLINGSRLAINMEKAAGFRRYAQLFAVYSTNDLPDEENYKDFFAIVDNARETLSHTTRTFCQAKRNEQSAAASDGTIAKRSITPYLSVEGAKLLAGDIRRLDVLYEWGVRFLTLVWGGECCIGGAHDTDKPLTPFGREVLERCFSLGIVPDVSHASDAVFWEVADAAHRHGKPFLASHSNARQVYAHSRNITNEMMCALTGAGGLCGISFCRTHLTGNPVCTCEDIFRHIDHFFSLGGEWNVALGGDLDGCSLPDDISDIRDLYRLADTMARHNYSDGSIRNVFYNNAAQFMKRNHVMPFPPASDGVI